MNILEKLFGSVARVKLIRFFLLSPEKVFTSQEAARLLKVSSIGATKEMCFLVGLGFIKNTFRTDEVIVRLGKRNKLVKKRIKGFELSRNFPYLLPLRNLLITASPVSRARMLQFFKNRGKIKLLALGGVFAGNFPQDASDGTVHELDLLIVGEAKRGSVGRFIGKLESEVGKELNWSLMSGFEFDYRLAMHDKLIRNLLDYPHEFLINKLELD